MDLSSIRPPLFLLKGPNEHWEVTPEVSAIKLTLGKFALVNTASLPLVLQYRWRAANHKHTYYAETTVRKLDGSGFTTLRLHQLLCQTEEVDHIDGNPLNNSRKNLRVCTNAENNRNKAMSPKKNTSGYKGVRWNASAGSWQARIRTAGKEMHIGVFASALHAAKAYDTKAMELHGKFAKLNFPEGEV